MMSTWVRPIRYDCISLRMNDPIRYFPMRQLKFDCQTILHHIQSNFRQFLGHIPCWECLGGLVESDVGVVFVVMFATFPEYLSSSPPPVLRVKYPTHVIFDVTTWISPVACIFVVRDVDGRWCCHHTLFERPTIGWYSRWSDNRTNTARLVPSLWKKAMFVV